MVSSIKYPDGFGRIKLAACLHYLCFAFLAALLFSGIVFAATKSSTFFSDFSVKSVSEISFNISATLSGFILPDSKQTLAEYAQTGQIDPTVISSNYDLSPVIDQTVTAYIVDPTDSSNQVKLCSWTTDSDGKGQCVATISAREATIKIRFEGTQELFPTQRFETLFSPSAFSFKELADSEWLVVFLFLGVLAAALYASGRKPMSAFDITTPRVKGIKVPKVAKLSVKTSTTAIKGTASRFLTPVAAAFYKAKNVDMNSLPTVNTLEKYTAGDKSSELMDIYKSKSEQERMLLIARKIREMGIREKMVRNLSTSRTAIKSLQKRRAKLESIGARVKSREEKILAQRSKRRLDELINKYTKQVKEYEADFKTLSGVALAKTVQIEKVDTEKVKVLIKEADSAILDEYSKYVTNPSHSTKPSFFGDLKDKFKEAVQKDFSNSKDLADKIDSVVQAKIELDRIYYSELSDALNQVNRNELNILEDPEESLHHKAIFSPSTSESERIDSIVEILNHYNSAQAKEFQGDILAISDARRNLDKALNRFLYSARSYKESSKDALEPNAFNSLVSFEMLSNRAEGYLDSIRRTGRFHSEYPIFNEKIAEQLTSIYRSKK